MSEALRVRAPAKLILSGEYAVLYGQPAIAIAVNYYTETVIRWQASQIIKFKFLDLEFAKEFTLETLKQFKKQIQRKYKAFLKGQCGIRDVIKMPFELLQYSVGTLIEKLDLQLANNGLEIQVNSNIPIGCGMGSSAAAIISLIKAITCLFNLKLEAKKLLSLGRDIEALQHGKSSGLDLHLSLMGGGIQFCNGKFQARNISEIATSYMYAVNTGMPQATTGESVVAAAKYFASGKLREDFGAITAALDDALVKNDLQAMQQTIQENHKLLQHIGVVPSRVADFIAAIEEQGGAAKICGAGSIKGDKGGMVLVVADRDLSSVAEQFDYCLQPIQVDYHGTRIV